MSYVRELLKKALEVERDVGTPIGICAIKQVQQQVRSYRLSSPAGRRAAVHAVEDLVGMKGCKACDVLDQGAADLRRMWNVRSIKSPW